jgi:hypothetical protein
MSAGRRSVLVVVFAVSRVPASVVDVVDVIAMRDRHMATALAVDMVVVLVHRVVAGSLAFVVMIVVPSMQMTVMDVVDMIAVRDRDIPTTIAMNMVMAGVLSVRLVAHFSSRYRICLAAVLGPDLSPVIRTGMNRH